MKNAGLKGLMARHGDRMDRGALVPQADVASLLANHLVAELLQCADQAITGDTSRQLMPLRPGSIRPLRNAVAPGVDAPARLRNEVTSPRERWRGVPPSSLLA